MFTMYILICPVMIISLVSAGCINQERGGLLYTLCKGIDVTDNFDLKDNDATLLRLTDTRISHLESFKLCTWNFLKVIELVGNAMINCNTLDSVTACGINIVGQCADTTLAEYSTTRTIPPQIATNITPEDSTTFQNSPQLSTNDTKSTTSMTAAITTANRPSVTANTGAEISGNDMTSTANMTVEISSTTSNLQSSTNRECECFRHHDTLRCQGHVIDDYCHFDQYKNDTSVLLLLQTRIINLGSLELCTWISLKSVVLTDNVLLDCKSVQYVTECYIVIRGQCATTTTTTTKTTTTRTTSIITTDFIATTSASRPSNNAWKYIGGGIGMSAVIAGVLALFLCRWRRGVLSNRDSFENPSFHLEMEDMSYVSAVENSSFDDSDL